nr:MULTISPECIES: DUF3000 domain-containing protein [Micrococcaceae]
MRSTGVPHEFSMVLDGLKRALVRPEMTLEEIPAPKRLAPYAVALKANVAAVQGDVKDETIKGSSAVPSAETDSSSELATGRFILLFDPQGNTVWDGTMRIVTYIRAEVDGEMGNDQLAASVAWTWLVEALEEHGAPYRRAGGTATRALSENFGDLQQRPDSVNIELRASWTPGNYNVQNQLEAWCDMVCSFAGLPPLEDGITPLPNVRLT